MKARQAGMLAGFLIAMGLIFAVPGLSVIAVGFFSAGLVLAGGTIGLAAER